MTAPKRDFASLPKTAANEAERIADLYSYEILDTGPDPRFNAFVRLASQFYGVPIALISLIDNDRQWFKARIGLDFQQTAREESFCAHTILTPDEVMVVEDARIDARFKDNPLVTGVPGIRFYAGAPITSASGHPLGSLCIIDRVPRTLNAAERARLADLASGVASVLELHRSLLRVEKAATQDTLTRLGNRALFEPHLERAVALAREDEDFALLCLDLDHFKAVNDQYGHDGGDMLLREAAKRLKASIREKDSAYRLGGDEFAVIMRGSFPPHSSRLLAERILAAFAAPMDIAGDAVLIRCSIGIAAMPADGPDGPAVSRAADMALYRAKALGGGAIVAAAELAPFVLPARQNTLELDLKKAVETGTLRLHWQPYFSATTGEVMGQEALARWDRPGHGPVSPGVFIPVAEQSDLIGKLDAWVLERACTEAASWPVAQHVSVNIAPHWFCRGDLTGLVAGVLARTGLDPRRLVLEMTERTLIDYPDLARRRILDLKEIGVRVALDDFGIGYAALSCLKDFDFDKLKLDRSFLPDIGQDARADNIVRAILALARALNMQVCAEGVETPGQLDFLRAEGCQLVQGFLLARPGPDMMFQALGDKSH